MHSRASFSLTAEKTWLFCCARGLLTLGCDQDAGPAVHPTNTQRISNTLGETPPGTEYLAAHVPRRESHLPRHHPRRIAWALTSGANASRRPGTQPQSTCRDRVSRHEPTLDLGRVRPIRMVTLTFASWVGHRFSKAKSRGDTPGYGLVTQGIVGLHTMIHLSLCRI